MSGLPFNPRAARLLERRDPQKFAQVMRILDLERADSERELYEGSLLEFFRRSWREIDPKAIVVNWHHELIIEKLEALAHGEIRNLVINIPGRHTKSLLCNVIFPTWLWIQKRDPHYPLLGPQTKFLTVAYGSTLAEEIGLKMKRLVEGEWFQGLWGDRVRILEDQQSRANFGNTAGGERISNSIEGGLLGRGGDCIIIDDPITPRSADSEIERENILRALSEGLMTRVTDPRIVARILIMQRLNFLDPTNWALETWPADTTEHIMLPSRFDPGRACPGDPRTEAGELLWPEMWDKESIDRQERELGPYAFAGQHQQIPSPRGGGIFKRDWLKPWPPSDNDEMVQGYIVNGRIQYPALEYVCAAVDTAFTERQENDPSAMIVLGVFRAEGKGRIERRPDGTYERVADDYGHSKILLLYGWMKRLELHGPPEEIPFGVSAKDWNGLLYREQRKATWGLCEWVADTCRRYKVDHLVIETQAAGHPLEQELRRLNSDGGWGVETFSAKGSKLARAYAVQHLLSSGQIYVPMFADGSTPSWCGPIIDELCVFNKGKHDDAVDAFTMALQHLRSTGIFERREEFEQFETELQTWQRNKPPDLPYSL